MSRTTASAFTATTVPSRPSAPAAGLRAWLFSYAEKMSWNDSSASGAGSWAVVESGASDFELTASEFSASDLLGSGMMDWARRSRIGGANLHKHNIARPRRFCEQRQPVLSDHSQGVVD